ncbi:flagellar filament capping protein FliD [Crenobacter cavernae]|uniref:Flagellar hook-associated protein 2 n=1 Tax=Crenobacter cavernae TaxID=2290923 RepID=A0ABY0FET5_9NEIS|nr:flagellar filament capping protein FliD [Crenobacter cavernae]RXZ44820.1 flagellar hook protein FliD [Crenobacter cavernae]
MALSVGGLGSGLQVDDLVSKLMAVESQPLNQLTVKEASYLGKVTALGSVKGAVSAFQTATKALQDVSKFSSITASSGNKDVVDVSAGDQAAVGNLSIKVDQLAQNQKLASTAFSSSKSAIGSGTLRFYFGTDNGGAGFALNGDKSYKDVTIPAGSTLEGVRDAVNKAGIGVTASIVNDGSGYKLVYSSNDTGTKNALKVASNDASLSSLTNADKLFTDGTFSAVTATTSANLSSVQAAKDAKFTLDGIAIVKSSNVVGDAVDGLTLTLKKAQESGDAPVSLSVLKDNSGIKKTLEGFVKAFNDLNKALNDSSSFDSSEPKKGEARKAAALNGESVIRTLRTQIRNTFNVAQDVGGAFRVPADVGINFNTDGSMKLDSTKLQKAIDSNPQDIAKLFGSVAAPTDSQVRFVSSGSKTASGSYAVVLGNLQNGTLLGGEKILTSVALDADTPFSVRIDGIDSNSIILPKGSGSYTPAGLATVLQNAINADTTLSAAGAKVNVTVDGATGKLILSSQKSGSGSTVEVLGGLNSVALNGGGSLNLFSTEAGVAGGTNVSGTIGGYAAVGDGKTLTGAVGTPVEGLKLEISGGAAGDRGSVTVTKGFSVALDKVLTELLDSKNGPIASRTEGLNKSVKDIGKQRDSLNSRLQDIEKRYRAQFNALDTLMSQFTSTSNFLTQQLAGLSKSS